MGFRSIGYAFEENTKKFIMEAFYYFLRLEMCCYHIEHILNRFVTVVFMASFVIPWRVWKLQTRESNDNQTRFSIEVIESGRTYQSKKLFVPISILFLHHSSSCQHLGKKDIHRA